MNQLPDKESIMRQIIISNELIWEKSLSRPKIDAWLSNFTGEVHSKDYEHQLALWLLLNFVYFNKHEVNQLCKVIFQQYLHQQLESYSDVSNLEEKIDEIIKKTIFTPLGGQGESGQLVLYLFRTNNGIGKRDIYVPTKSIGSSKKTVVFIDDVTFSEGDDSQAWDYLKAELELFDGLEIYLLTFLASQGAIDFLTSKGITVINGITLNDESRAFTSNSQAFSLAEHLREDAKVFAEHYGKKLFPDFPLGYSACQYLFGFFYNTPDNTLPIIWSSDNNWEPIFPRRTKLYRSSDIDDWGIYV